MPPADTALVDQAGFTLVETLVALVLFAMLTTVAAQAVQSGGRAWSQAERRTADADAMDSVQLLLRRTILRAQPQFASADPRDLALAFTGGPDAMALVVPRPGSADTGPPVLAQLGTSVRDGSRSLTMTWDQSGGPVLLLDHVASVRFAYFGAPNAADGPAWREDWAAASRLPSLVRVRIVRQDTTLPPWPDLYAAPLATTNPTCVFQGRATGCRRMTP